MHRPRSSRCRVRRRPAGRGGRRRGAACRWQRVRRRGGSGVGGDRAAALEVRPRGRPRRDQRVARWRSRGAARHRRRARRPGGGRRVRHVARRRAALGGAAGRTRRVRGAGRPRQPPARTPRSPGGRVGRDRVRLGGGQRAAQPHGCSARRRDAARRLPLLPRRVAHLRWFHRHAAGPRRSHPRARRARGSVPRGADRRRDRRCRAVARWRAHPRRLRVRPRRVVTVRDRPRRRPRRVGDAGADARPVAARGERGHRTRCIAGRRVPSHPRRDRVRVAPPSPIPSAPRW